MPLYESFRRRAFDAKFVAKSFLDYRDGVRFFEDLDARDPSPYNHQQLSLYLAAKKRYKDACSAADEAVSLSRGRIISIRNTRAQIFFDANIGLTHEPHVRDTLKDSLGVLENCRQLDKRKAFHALTYAAKACQYWDAYSDDDARLRLKKGEEWLMEELDNPLTKREAAKSLVEVRARISSDGGA